MEGTCGARGMRFYVGGGGLGWAGVGLGGGLGWAGGLG